MEAVARPSGFRAMPWAVWILLVLAGLIIVRSLTQGSLGPLAMIASVAPLLLAAAVIYMAPPDRRFVWASLAIAFPIAARVLAAWLPDAWLSVAPGDWKNAVPLLHDLGSGANEIATFVGLAGIALLGFALGGVRSFMSALIIGFAAIVAAAGVIWVNAQGIDNFPLLQLIESLGFAVLSVILWGFVFAAALESLRSVTLVGSGLVFANIVINDLLLWWRPGPGANGDLLTLISTGPAALGWVLLIVAVLRAEWNDAPSGARSRAGRGSGARRRAG